MSYVLSKKTVSTAKGVGVSSEKYPKLHLVDVMSDTWYPIPPGFHPNKKWLKEGRFTLKIIFGTGNRIFGQNTSENLKMHIFAVNWHLKVVESWKKNWGSSNHLSKSCKKIKSLLACRYEWQRFQKCTTFFGTPCIYIKYTLYIMYCVMKYTYIVNRVAHLP